MKNLLITLLLTQFVTSYIQAQSVGVGTTAPNSTAILDVSSSNRGMLIPRLTTAQRKAISNPSTGLLVYDLDRTTVMFFDGANWKALSFTDESIIDPQVRNTTAPQANSYFGSRVAISGNYAIIGSPKYSGGDIPNMGAAYIFVKTSTGWRQQSRLVAYDSARSDYFGGSVAISGDYAVVGACNKSVGANNYQGRVYVYRRNGNAWQLDSAFKKPGGAAGEYFGWSVGISAYSTGGPSIAIGIPYSTAGGISKGEVYTYKRGGTAWAFTQNIAPTDLLNYDNFGFTISMDSDYVAVGAPLQDNATYAYADAGAVYVYAYGGNVWNFQQKLAGTVAQAQFGAAMSIFSNKMAIGAPWATPYTNSSAAVYIYTRTGALWRNNTYLFLYDYEVPGSTSLRFLTFGLALSLYDNTLLVGSSGGLDYPNGGSSYYSSRQGAVYIYKNLSGDSYTKTQILTSEFPGYSDLYGESVSLSNGNFLIANPKAIVNGLVNAGNVYFGFNP